MRSLARALGFLSVLPAGKLGEFETAHLPAMLAAFPLAGALIGALLGLIWCGLSMSLDASLAAALTVCFWVLLTRGLHLDGLADCADGLGGSYTPEGRLKIMKDPHVGVFGTAAIGMSLLIKYAALLSLASRELSPIVHWNTPWSEVINRMLLLATIFSVSRFCVLCVSYRAHYARAGGGMGEQFIVAVHEWVLMAGVVVPACLSSLWGLERGARLFFCPVLAALLLRILFQRALNGQTGDTLGATVEAGEFAGLIAAG